MHFLQRHITSTKTMHYPPLFLLFFGGRRASSAAAVDILLRRPPDLALLVTKKILKKRWKIPTSPFLLPPVLLFLAWRFTKFMLDKVPNWFITLSILQAREQKLSTSQLYSVWFWFSRMSSLPALTSTCKKRNAFSWSSLSTVSVILIHGTSLLASYLDTWTFNKTSEFINPNAVFISILENL